MAKRILIVVISFILMAILVLPQFAASIDLAIPYYLENYHFPPLEDLVWSPLNGWVVMFSNTKIMQIYLMSDAILALLLFLLIAKGSGVDYQSRMQRITPKIITPCADGQGQCGTARWMEASEKRQVFTVWKVPRRSAGLRELRKTGKSDRKEIRNANVHID